MRRALVSGLDVSCIYGSQVSNSGTQSARLKASSSRHTSARKTGAQKSSAPPKRSKPEIELTAALDTAGLSRGVEHEHRFHPTRRWRFDFAWPVLRVAVEVEGGVWSRGRHNRPQGFIDDCEKYNEAALRGWTVLRLVPRKGWIEESIPLIKRALETLT